MLGRYAAAVGLGPDELDSYEPRALAQGYAGYMAWSALYGTRSGVALAMLVNFGEWGAYCQRAAEALVGRYGLGEEDVAFFRFFAELPPGFTEQATEVLEAGLAAGESAREAVRAARLMHEYEVAFWDSLAYGIG